MLRLTRPTRAGVQHGSQADWHPSCGPAVRMAVLLLVILSVHALSHARVLAELPGSGRLSPTCTDRCAPSAAAAAAASVFPMSEVPASSVATPVIHFHRRLLQVSGGSPVGSPSPVLATTNSSSSSSSIAYVAGSPSNLSGVYKPATAAAAAAASQANNTHPLTDLRAALTDRAINTIVVVGAARLASVWPHGDGDVINIDRNLTITGADPAAGPRPTLLAPGDDLAPEWYPVLDLGYLQNKLGLCATCTLTFSYLALEGERRGSGALIDAVYAGPGGMLRLQQVLRLRSGCVPWATALNSTLHTPRPARYPGQQQVQLVNVSWWGKDYPQSLVSTDVVQDVAPVLQETGVNSYGYTLAVTGGLRLCAGYVNQRCVESNQLDLCVNREIDAMLAGAAGPVAAGGRSLGAGAAGGIALGVVAGVLLLSAFPLLMWWRKRQRHKLLEHAGPLLGEAGGGGTGTRLTPADPTMSVEVGKRLLMDSRVWMLAGTTTASNVCWASGASEGGDSTAGSQAVLEDDPILLGVLLGAGAYGRVYRGFWRGMAVAVKVMDYELSMAQAVMNEVKLVTSFDHPHVVRAYHSATWVSRPQQPSAGSRTEGDRGGVASARGTSVGRSGTASRTRTTGPSQPATSSPAAAHTAPAATSSSSITRTRSPPEPLPVQVTDLSAVAEEECGFWQQEPQLSRTAHSGGAAPCIAPERAPPPAAASSAGRSASTTPPSRSTASISRSHTPPPAPAPAAAAGVAVAQGPSPAASTSPHSSPLVTNVASVYALMILPTDGDFPEDLVDLEPAVGAEEEQEEEQDSVSRLSFWLHRPATVSTAVAWDAPNAVNTTPPAATRLSPNDSTPLRLLPQQRLSPGRAGSAPPPAAVESVPIGPRGNSSNSSSQHLASLSSPGTQLQPQAASTPPGRGLAGEGSPAGGPRPAPSPAGQAAHVLAEAGGTGGFWGTTTTTTTATTGGRRRTSGRDEGRAQTWLVLELCEGGTLADVLASSEAASRAQTEQMVNVMQLLRDTAAGVAYLHARNVVHGDLNARNVLVAASGDTYGGLVSKVADFGLSRRMTANRSHRTTATAGTLNHSAPELLRLGKMSPAVDVYAFGIMMWEAFTGETAFSALMYGQIFEAVVLGGARPRIPPFIPPAAAALMAACWSQDPAARPTMAAVELVLQRMLEAAGAGSSGSGEGAPRPPGHLPPSPNLAGATRAHWGEPGAKWEGQQQEQQQGGLGQGAPPSAASTVQHLAPQQQQGVDAGAPLSMASVVQSSAANLLPHHHQALHWPHEAAAALQQQGAAQVAWVHQLVAQVANRWGHLRPHPPSPTQQQQQPPVGPGPVLPDDTPCSRTPRLAPSRHLQDF